MDIATFRSVYPEFANSTTYPDAQVQYYLTQGAVMLNSRIWLALQDQGLGLYTAHYLALAQQRARAAAAGGVPGGVQGPTSSKSVADVAVSYDTAAVTLENGGQWNLTTYGVEFLQLARMVGAQGMIQTGGGFPGVNLGVFGNGIGW